MTTTLLAPAPVIPPTPANIFSKVPQPKPKLPFGFDSNAANKPLWQMIVERLPAKDPETEWYVLTEIAPLLGIRPRSLAKHCRDLWPQWEGQYRLNYAQAVSLIRRVCFAGRKLPSRKSMEDTR